VSSRIASRREPRLPKAKPAQQTERETGWARAFYCPQGKLARAGKRAEQERQPALDLEPDGQPVLPSLELLQSRIPSRPRQSTKRLSKKTLGCSRRCWRFWRPGQIVQVRPGRSDSLRTRAGARNQASRIIGLADDIARSMSAISVRVAVVSGRNVIGIELPNRKAETVFYVSYWIRRFTKSIPAPRLDPGEGHFWRAGAGRSGQNAASVDCGHDRVGQIGRINTMILSFSTGCRPIAANSFMVDPKMLELSSMTASRTFSPRSSPIPEKRFWH